MAFIQKWSKLFAVSEITHMFTLENNNNKNHNDFILWLYIAYLFPSFVEWISLIRFLMLIIFKHYWNSGNKNKHMITLCRPTYYS